MTTLALYQVVALLLSMRVGLQAAPMGYDYPTPAVPFIEGPVSTTTPAPSPEYDDYDPNDIPADQAAPDNKGYEYPVPQNPLVLPTKAPKPQTTTTTTTSAPLPDCIPVEERDLGMNMDLLDAGVPLCPDYEEYDPLDIPEDQAPTAPECVLVDEQDDGYNPVFIEQGVPLCPEEEELPGYNYPAPENPLELPTKAPTTTTTTTSAPLPDCIPVEERDLGMNTDLLDAGVPLCPDYEDYNPFDIPEDQAPTAPECVPADEQNDGYNPIFIEQGVPLCPEEVTGYEYPVPENPLTLPPKKTTTTASPAPSQAPTLEVFEDYYDEEPEETVEIEDEQPGYEYTETTTAAPLPDCIPVEERDLGMNTDLIEAGVPICPDYEEYDPLDIPEDQAPPAPDCVPADEQDDGYNPVFIEQGVPLCPEEEELPGYNYPVPENPLVLPTKAPTTTTTTTTTTTEVSLPDCIEESDKDTGSNPSFIELGVPLCPQEYIDEYDPFDVPIDQAPTPPDCVAEEEQNEGYNPVFIENGVPLCPQSTTGYEYPVPENPLTLPPRQTTAAPVDDYDINDIPEDQAAPAPDCVLEEEKDVGSNPVFLSQGVPLCPTDLSSYQPTTSEPSEPPAEVSYDDYDPSDIPQDQAAPPPDCVNPDEQDSGPNPGFIAQGVPLCPEEQGYSYPVPENPLQLPQKRRKSKGLPKDMLPEEGVTVTGRGTVLSFHIPSSGHDSAISSSDNADDNDKLKLTLNKSKAKTLKKHQKKEKSKQKSTHKKARKGKSLEDSSSDTVALSDNNKEERRPKKTGIRTISVKEWLRRG